MRTGATLFLVGLLATLAASVAAARAQADNVLWVADPSDFTGATVILSVEASEPFIHLFLYPNGNFQIGAIDQPACHVIVGPSGPGVGCDAGTTSSFRVRFRTAAAIPAGTSAKLVLDNPGGGARALTVSLKNCTPEARLADEKQTRFKVAYENSEASLRLLQDASRDMWNRILREADWITAELKKALPNLRLSDLYPTAFSQAAVNSAARVMAASNATFAAMIALQQAHAEREAADKALADCLSSPAKIRTLAGVAECSFDDVVKQVRAVKIVNGPAALKRIATEAVNGKRAAALRDLAKLRTLVAANRAVMNAAVQAFATCAPG